MLNLLAIILHTYEIKNINFNFNFNRLGHIKQNKP
jgi:hypothetical protein